MQTANLSRIERNPIYLCLGIGVKEKTPHSEDLGGRNKDKLMINGRVKWFNDARGYGFIESKGEDYFVYFKDIVKDGYKTLKDGDKVLFEPSSSPKGLVAKSVTVNNP